MMGVLAGIVGSLALGATIGFLGPIGTTGDDSANALVELRPIALVIDCPGCEYIWDGPSSETIVTTNCTVKFTYTPTSGRCDENFCWEIDPCNLNIKVENIFGSCAIRGIQFYTVPASPPLTLPLGSNGSSFSQPCGNNFGIEFYVWVFDGTIWKSSDHTFGCEACFVLPY